MNTRRRIGLILLVIILLGVGWLGFKAWRIAAAGRSLLAAQDRVSALQDAPGGLPAANPDEVDDLIAGVRADVVTLNDEIRPFLGLTPWFGWLPRVGPIVVEADHYLALADAGTSAADALRPMVRDGLVLIQSNPPNLLNPLIDLVAANGARLAAIEPDVLRAVDEYNAITSWEALPWAIRRYKPRADEYVPLAPDGIKLAQLAPILIGANGNLRTYMLLAQNSDELRATGGYLSGVGFLEVRDGDILSLSLSSGDEINRNLFEESELYPFPPDPLLRYMGLQYHIFRDSNYWPDFPTSVQKAIELYTLGQPDTPPVDGVIAFNQRLLTALVAVLQPLYIDAYKTSVNSANLTEFVWAAYDPADDQTIGYEWYSQRKAFMGLLAQAIIGKVTTDPGAIDALGLARAVLDEAAARNLLLYMNDPAIQALVADLGWDGAIRPYANQDQLLVVDSNMGYNKANFIIERVQRYTVNVGDPAAPTADLTVQYTHPGQPFSGCQQFQTYTDLEGRGSGGLYEGYVQSCYYNYVRVYTPQNVTLRDATRQGIPAAWMVTGEAVTDAVAPVDDTPGFGGFSNFLVVQRGGRETMTLRYALPANVVQASNGTLTYRLTALKAPGAANDALFVTVNLPIGAQIASIEGPGNIVGNRVEFNLTLDRDTTIAVTYSQP